jgi:methionyl-tRNA formyltransferase
MRVVFAGTPEPALASLRALVASRHDVVAVVTRPDARAGRGRELRPSPVSALADELGLPVLKPSHPGDPEFLTALADLAPAACPVVAYGALVPRAALDVPPLGWVNLHFSLLPAWRGAAPVQHAILAGDEVTGATTFVLEEGLDTGPVLGLVTETIRPTDTSGELLDRLAVSGAQLLVASLDALEDGSVRPHPQALEGVSLAPKLTTDDARVDWSAPALRVDRLARACTPAPGAWTMLGGDRLKIGPVSLAGPHGGDALVPGEVVVDRTEVLVGTGSHAVRLGLVGPQGRRLMPAADWARGARIETGDRLGA